MGVADRKAREFERREQDILKAAYTLFMDKGPKMVTNEMIAEASEIGKGTIYKHFKSKSDIFAVLLIQHVNLLHCYVIDNFNYELPVLERIKEFLRLHLNFFAENPGAHKICIQFRSLIIDDNLDPDVAKRYHDMYREKNLMLEKMIDEAIELDLVIDLPAPDITALVTGMLLGIMNELSSDFISDRETLDVAIVEGSVKSVLK